MRTKNLVFATLLIVNNITVAQTPAAQPQKGHAELSEIPAARMQKGQLDLSKIPVPQPHYLPEYTFDVPTDAAGWTRQRAGLNAGFGSTDKLYLRCETPFTDGQSLKSGMSSPAAGTPDREISSWKATGWRGERLSAQVLVWSPDSIEQIRFRAGNLVSGNGNTIANDNIDINMVRYVVSNLPYGADNFTCDAPMGSAWLVPDRFESFERFDLPGKTVRPVWISFDIPRNAAPGDYTGTIEVRSLKDKVDLQVSLTVQNQTLSEPKDWKFRLDLWQNPWVVAWYYHVEPWSAEHIMLLKKHLKLYADAGGKYITTYAVHSPWADNSYMIEKAMIEVVKGVDGKWEFDYTIFDKYVELAMEMGIDNSITVYTLIPWGNRFRYMDRKSGNYVYEEWAPDSPSFVTFWNYYLDDLKAHLTAKGWFGKTYLGINENPLDYTMTAVKVIKEHSKDWRITYAGDWHAELSPLLDDYSPIITSEPSPEELKERSSKGFTTTYYVCCNPPKPNNFVFSPPVEGRFIGWYALSYGYDGFLRWAYDAWPADPVRDARHTLWPAGDCFMVYPGGNSCIRFEKLREGIADFEKMQVLRAEASGSNSKKVQSLMKELEVHLATFAAERDHNKRDFNTAKMIEDVNKGNELIRQLSEALSKP